MSETKPQIIVLLEEAEAAGMLETLRYVANEALRLSIDGTNPERLKVHAQFLEPYLLALTQYHDGSETAGIVPGRGATIYRNR